MQYKIGTGGNWEKWYLTVIASRENGKYRLDVIGYLLFDMFSSPAYFHSFLDSICLAFLLRDIYNDNTH